VQKYRIDRAKRRQYNSADVFVCCISKITHKHTHNTTQTTHTRTLYVIPTAFPQQQRLRECALISHYVCIVYLVEKPDAYITTDEFNNELN